MRIWCNFVYMAVGTSLVSLDNDKHRTVVHGRLARWRNWSVCEVGKATEGLMNELSRRWSDGRLENELWRKWRDGRVREWITLIVYISCRASFSNPSLASPTSLLILQLFRRFTCVTAHFPTFPSLQLRHSSFFNHSVALATQRHFTYVTWRASHVVILAKALCFRLVVFNLFISSYP